MSLEANPSPVDLSDEIPALAGTSIAAVRDPEAEGPAKLCLDSWSIETVR